MNTIRFEKTKQGFEGFSADDRLLFSVTKDIWSGEKLFLQLQKGLIPLSDLKKIIEYAEVRNDD